MEYTKGEYLEHIDKKAIVALIPARGGSKGVPKKNIQHIKEFPLIAYTIAACKLSKKINRIVVSTDSEEIAQIAIKYGAEIPFLRPAEYASDHSGDMEFVWHAINYFMEQEGNIPEYLVHMRPTTPYRDAEIVDKAIGECIKNGNCSSLRSGHESSESPYKWFLMKEDNYFTALSDRISNDIANTARQNFPKVYIPDGYVDVLKSSYIIENQKLHGENMLGFISPMCSEIDTIDDLEYIRFLIDNKGSSIYEYLKQNYL